MMNTFAGQTGTKSLSIVELQQHRMLGQDFDLPVSFQTLSNREQISLLEAGTKLFSSNSPIYLVQRNLFAAMVLDLSCCPRLREYCAAMIDLSVADWDYFAENYWVKVGGGRSLAVAHTAYVALFLAES